MKLIIENNLVVKIFRNEDDEFPHIIQPHQPDGTPWADEAEARAWAEALLEEITPRPLVLPEEAPAEEPTPAE